MLNKLQHAFQFEEAALRLRGKRQEILSANIANDNTPGYKARDIDFAATLASQLNPPSGQNHGVDASSTSVTRAQHISSAMEGTAGDMDSGLMYRVPHQSSVDGNTVELESEKSRATENSMHYLSVSGSLQQNFLWWSRFLQDTR